MAQSIPIDPDFTLPVLWALGWGVELTSWIPSPDAFCAATTLFWCLLQIRRASLCSIGILPSHLFLLRRLSIALLCLAILAIGVLVCEHFDNVKSRWLHVLLNVLRLALFETITNGLALLFSAQSASSTASLAAIRVAAAGAMLYAIIMGSLMVGDFIQAGDQNGVASNGVRLFAATAHAGLGAAHALYFLILKKGRPAVRPYAWFSVTWRALLSLCLFLSIHPPSDTVFQAWVLDVALLALFIFAFPLSIRAAFRADAAFWRGIPQVKNAQRLQLAEWSTVRPTSASLKLGLRSWTSLLQSARSTDSAEGTGLLAAGGPRTSYGIGQISARQQISAVEKDEEEVEQGGLPSASTRREQTTPEDEEEDSVTVQALKGQSPAYDRLVQQLSIWAQDVNDLPDECLGTLMDLVEASAAIGYLLDFQALESQIPVYRGTEAVVLRGVYSGPLQSTARAPGSTVGTPKAGASMPQATSVAHQVAVKDAAVKVAVKVASPIKVDRLAMERICAEVAVNIQLSESIRSFSVPLAANTGYGYTLRSPSGRFASSATSYSSHVGATAPLHGLLTKWTTSLAAPGLTVSALEASRSGSTCLVPFHGVCVCPPDVALVFPWCEGGTVRYYLDRLLLQGAAEASVSAQSGEKDSGVPPGSDASEGSSAHECSYGLVRYMLPTQQCGAADGRQAVAYASNGSDLASAGLTIEAAGVRILRSAPSEEGGHGGEGSSVVVDGLTEVGLEDDAPAVCKDFKTSTGTSMPSPAPAAWALSPDEADALADETSLLEDYTQQGIVSCCAAPLVPAGPQGTTGFRHTDLQAVQPLHLAVAARTMAPGMHRLAATAWVIGCSQMDVVGFSWDRPQDWDVADIAGLWKCWQCKGGAQCTHAAPECSTVDHTSRVNPSCTAVDTGARGQFGPKTTGAQRSVIQRLSIALDAARALAFLHGCLPRPLLHRDIKSLNILLKALPPSSASGTCAVGSDGHRSNAKWKALLGDFGESRALAAPVLTDIRARSRPAVAGNRPVAVSSPGGRNTGMWSPEGGPDEQMDDSDGTGYIGPDDDYRDRHVSDARLGQPAPGGRGSGGTSVSSLDVVEEADELQDATEIHGQRSTGSSWWSSAGRSFGIGLPFARTYTRAGRDDIAMRGSSVRGGQGRPRAGSTQQMTGNVGTTAWMAPEVLRVQEEAEELTERGGVLALRGPESLSRSRTRTSRAISAGFGHQAKYGTPADVYSLGLVLWELATGGSPSEVGIAALKSGVGGSGVLHAGDFAKLTKASAVLHARPEIPPCMPASYRFLMSCCWHPQQECRPPAALVAMVLQRMLAQAIKLQHDESGHARA